MQYAFIGAGGGTIKKYNLPDGEFCHNMIQTQPGIINCMAINPDGVVASGADDGSLWSALLTRLPLEFECTGGQTCIALPPSANNRAEHWPIREGVASLKV